MASLLPPVESDDARDTSHRYALVEMGALPIQARSLLIDSVAGAYWSLIRDTAQEHLIREGPWLLRPDPASLAAWQDLEGLSCALHAWIDSPLEGDALAKQLAPAMTIECPERRAWLLRFYLPNTIRVLHAETQASWYAALFSGITRWWCRDDRQHWQPLAGLPADGIAHDAWRLSADEALWQALRGDPEVMALTTQLLRDMPGVFEGLCACDRPRRVEKALAAADAAQLTRPDDRRTYAYLWLIQGESHLKEAPMADCIAQAAQGGSPLLERLQTIEEA